MVKGGVIFSFGFTKAIEFDNDGKDIKVNPKLLLNDIINDFDKYIKELRNESDSARDKFDRIFKVI